MIFRGLIYSMESLSVSQSIQCQASMEVEYRFRWSRLLGRRRRRRRRQVILLLLYVVVPL